MPGTVNLKNIAVVLHQPRHPENIGAAARAIKNMGLSRLVVVDPRNCDLTSVLKMATHTASDVVEEMGVFEELGAALADFQYVVGTTARLGGQRKVVNSPRTMAAKLAELAENNRIALLFGPEDRGLTNADLRLCHELVTIPTDAFSSLNLGQAVMVMCYEISTTHCGPDSPFAPRLASRYELDGMYADVKDVLVRINYVQPDNPDYFMNNFRHFFTRLRLTAKEVSLMRGVCRQIRWYGRKSFEDGLKACQEK